MPAGGSRLQFGEFEFDSAAGELYGKGQRMRLQEQPRQVLAALLERPGEVVTREELRERLWTTETFVDFEHGLNTAIKKVRQALGDSAEEPRYIETLARRGYRFIAPVTIADPAGSSPPGVPVVVNDPAPPASVTQHSRRPVLLAAFVPLVIIIIAGTVWLAQRDAHERPPYSERPAQLAVIPLRVLTPADADDPAYLGIGIADAITTRLANVRQIAVRPTSAGVPYTNAESDPSRVAAALGVEHLLLGTIQRAHQSYRVSVQLVRADGVAVWGRAYDVPRAGLLHLQDAVAEQVAAALRIELSEPERARLGRPDTGNPDAYEHYLRGRALLLYYNDTNMREAISRFEQALILDQGYARARAGLATACAWFSVRYAYESQAATWGERAEREARLALEQDAALGDAHLAIANAAGTVHRGFDWKTLLDESAAALELDPSLDMAHVARMRAFYHLGQFDRAREEGRLAARLTPVHSVETARVEVALLLFSGEFADAAKEAEVLLKRTDAPVARHYLGLARYYLGDANGARQMLASAVRGGQPDIRAQASLASIEAAMGATGEARARAARIGHGPYIDHHVAYSLGATYAQMGEIDESVQWLTRAVESGFPCWPWFDRDPLLDPVRRHPSFVTMRARFADR